MAVNPKDIPINQAVSITLDGKKISGFENETIFNIAKREIGYYKIFGIIKTTRSPVSNPQLHKVD